MSLSVGSSPDKSVTILVSGSTAAERGVTRALDVGEGARVLRATGPAAVTVRVAGGGVDVVVAVSGDVAAVVEAAAAVPVIALVADDARGRAALDRGATDYLRRDDDPPACLRRVIERAVAVARLRAERDAARREAAIAERCKAEFLAVASHELRTPLNAIIGFSEMLSEGYVGALTDSQRDYLADIGGAAHHLLGLVSDVLDLAKAAGGTLALDEEVLDIGAVIDACLRLMAMRAAAAGVRLDRAIADGMPWLHADRRRLKRLLVNLLSNAIKYSPAGGVVVVRAAIAADDGAEISVSDGGVGMTADEIGAATAIFSQGDARIRRDSDGAGLGLSLSKTLAESHGGRLDIASIPGSGTTITVWLPPSRRVVVAAE